MPVALRRWGGRRDEGHETFGPYGWFSMAEAAPAGLERVGGRGRLWRRCPTWLALFVLALSLYLLTLPADLRNNADTVDRFMVTQKVLHGTLEVACGRWPGDARLILGRHGCYYAIYGPGQTLLMAPLYVLGKAVATITEPAVAHFPKVPTGVNTSKLSPRLKRQVATAGAVAAANAAHDSLDEAIFARMLDPILGAILLVLFFLLALELGFAKRTAILLTLALGFASTVFADVQSGQEQIQSTLAVVGLTYCLIRVRRAQEQGRPRWLFAAGVASGFGIFTRYDFAVVIVVFAFVLGAPWLWRTVVQGSRVKDAAANRPEEDAKSRVTLTRIWSAAWPLAVGFLPFVAVDAGWNTVRFGAPWKVGQSIGDQFGTPLWNGVASLLVSPGKGLIWYLPLLWLVPFGWRYFRRRDAQVFWLGIATLVALLLFYAPLKYWHGDPAWGPRYLFPTVPLLLLPLGELFERFRGYRPTARTAIIGVAGLSLVVQLVAVSVDPWRFWYHLVEERKTQHVAFNWNFRQYGYYWSSNPSFSPLIYQFAAAADVARIATDGRAALPEAHGYTRTCMGLNPRTQTDRFDRCKLDGLSVRPLNTVSPIWLNDRYQFENAGSVPLALIWRILIVGALVLTALLSAAVLHLQFWKPNGRAGPA